MDYSFIQQSFRILLRNKATTIINVLGLAVGIGFSLLTYSVLLFELSFDKHHKDADRIYRINSASMRGGEERNFPATPYPLAAALREEAKGVEHITRVWFSNEAEVIVASKPDLPFYFDNEAASVDAEFFEVFNFPIVSGNPTPLKEPNKVVISQQMAERLFAEVPNNDIIGRTLRYNDTYDLTVEAIMANPPASTDLPLHFLVSTKTLESDPQIQDWPRIDFGMQTFVKLQAGTDNEAFLEETQQIVAKNAGEYFANFFKNDLQAMEDLHFDTSVGGFNRTIAKDTLWMFGLIGIVILITACINFINLATANAVVRSKEIGIKKILGSSRSSLLRNILFETALVCAIATILGIILAYLVHPMVVEILGFEPPFNVFSFQMMTFIVVLIVGVVLFSGLYPAIVTSAFKPIDVMKQGFTKKGKSGLLLRRVLVVLQFGISQALIICTLVVASQLDFFISKDLGFNKEAIVNIALPQQGLEANKPFVDALETISQVKHFTLANGAPSSGNIWMHSFGFDGSQEEERHIAHGKYADTKYLETFGMELLAGRNYLESDTLREVVINEMMMHEMGILSPEEAIGKNVDIGRTTVPIVGVVRDWHLVSLREPIQPSFIGMNTENFWKANIKLNATNIAQGLQAVEQAWEQVYPNEPFGYQFLDEQLAGFYDQEERLGQLLNLFAGIAIFISCLGLIGLVSFMVNQKLKEIGIRKVLGAGAQQIIMLFSKEFALLIVIAFAVASPIAIYYMRDWLDSFAYSIELTPFAFILAIAVSFTIAFAMVFLQAFRAARLNPASILRDE